MAPLEVYVISEGGKITSKTKKSHFILSKATWNSFYEIFRSSLSQLQALSLKDLQNWIKVSISDTYDLQTK